VLLVLGESAGGSASLASPLREIMWYAGLNVGDPACEALHLNFFAKALH